MSEESRVKMSDSQVAFKLNALESMYINQDKLWEIHDKRSKENWARVDNKLDKIVGSVESVKKEITDIKVSNAEKPCEVHNEKMKGLEGSVKFLSVLVVSVILLGIVLGIWIKGV